MVVYGLVGVFGAARYGLATQGDLLVNTWLGGRAEGILDAVLVAYLAISIPPVQVSRPSLAPLLCLKLPQLAGSIVVLPVLRETAAC